MTFTLMPKWAGISQPSHFATWEGLQPTRHQSPLRPVPAEANLNTLQDLSTSLNEFNISQLLIFLHHLLHAYGRTIPSCVGGSIHSSSGDSPGIRNAAGIAAPSGRKMLLRSSQHHPHNLHRYLMISHTSIHSPILGSTFTCTCQWKLMENKAAEKELQLRQSCTFACCSRIHQAFQTRCSKESLESKSHQQD